MRKEDKITINGIQVTIKELTVAEVRHWMMDMIEKEKANDNLSMITTALDQGLFEEIGLSDLLRMSDLEREQIDEFTPAELQVIIKRCKVLNPDFFGMRQRLLGLVPKNASAA
ncbi:MAG: hypothetical protein U1E78_11685 [Gammaproteobacteria bacterium]